MTWLPYAFVSAGAAALTAILAKIGVEGVPSNVATAIRTLVVVVFAWVIAVGVGEHRAIAHVSGRSWLFLTLSGIATGVSWLAYFRALQLGDAARVAPIDKLSVVMVAVFGVAFLGERLTALNWLGVASIGGGAILVAYRG